MKPYLVAAAALAATALGALAQSQSGVVLPIKQVSVQSPVQQTELITDMRVKEGDRVKKGELLVQLRNEHEALDVKLTEKLIELKKFIARGHERLFKEEAGSEHKALEAKTDVELAQLQLQSKKISLEEKSIVSPLDGIVVKKYKETGESVMREDKLLDIINIDKVIARFFLPPNLRPALKDDARVDVKIENLNNAVFPGTITFIDPRNDAASGLVQVLVEIDNPGHKIAPGMKALADFGK